MIGERGEGAMTPEQMQLVRHTATIVTAQSERFGTRFYERLFSAEPSLRGLFGSDMTEQRGKIVDELGFLIGAVDDLDTFVEEARSLGSRHHRYGARHAHYRLVEEALIGTLAELAGPDWNEASATAWHHLYNLIAESMIEGSANHLFESTP
jgi:hemoglobin-like flavoprotein